jgi:hypothetical protein
MSWRSTALPIIARVLQETAGRPEPEIRKALTDAYPFGERRMWPYKVWLSEVKRQRHGGPKRSGNLHRTEIELAGQGGFDFGGEVTG